MISISLRAPNVLPCLHDTIASWPPLIILQTFIVLVETTLAIVNLRELAIDRCYDAGLFIFMTTVVCEITLELVMRISKQASCSDRLVIRVFTLVISLPSFPLHSVTCAFRLILTLIVNVVTKISIGFVKQKPARTKRWIGFQEIAELLKNLGWQEQSCVS